MPAKRKAAASTASPKGVKRRLMKMSPKSGRKQSASQVPKQKKASPKKKTKGPGKQQSAETPAATRRDSDEAASRAIKTKLLDNGYDEEIVKSARNKDGQGIYELVAAEIARTRGKNSYLKTSFWVQIH